MATTHTRVMTFAEFSELPDEVCRRHELRHGELVPVAPPKHKHYRVQRRLRQLLEKALGSQGVVEMEMAFRALPEFEYRVADIAFISQARWDAIPDDGNLAGSPELVVDVLSPSNTTAPIHDKRALCLKTGCIEFWIVDIEKCEIEVSTADGRSGVYRSGQHVRLLSGAGQSVMADAIFSQL